MKGQSTNYTVWKITYKQCLRKRPMVVSWKNASIIPPLHTNQTQNLYNIYIYPHPNRQQQKTTRKQHLPETKPYNYKYPTSNMQLGKRCENSEQRTELNSPQDQSKHKYPVYQSQSSCAGWCPCSSSFSCSRWQPPQWWLWSPESPRRWQMGTCHHLCHPMNAFCFIRQSLKFVSNMENACKTKDADSLNCK